MGRGSPRPIFFDACTASKNEVGRRQRIGETKKRNAIAVSGIAKHDVCTEIEVHLYMQIGVVDPAEAVGSYIDLIVIRLPEIADKVECVTWFEDKNVGTALSLGHRHT